MRNHIMRVLPVAIGVGVGVVACNDSDGGGFHNCSPTYNNPSAWEQFDLALSHNEPRRCPVLISAPGEYVIASGTILDRGSRDFLQAKLTVSNSDWFVVAVDEQYFGYNPGGHWVAQHYTSYPAATGGGRPPSSDDADYRLGAGTLDDISAQVRITYGIQ